MRHAARARPDSPAVVHNGRTISYSRLVAAATTVAHRLGPRPGVVAVPAGHGPATVVGLLGVWTAAGTYCPVDPGFPPARRRSMLTAVGCRTALGAAALDAALDATLDATLEPAAPAGPADPAGPAEPADLATAGLTDTDPDAPAYILFTSGSTGRPKPVVTPHRAIGSAVPALGTAFGLTAADRVLQFASLNWDTCFEEILPTLTTGATVVFDDEAYTGSFRRFLRMVDRQRLTVLDLPSAYWHELVRHLVEEPAALPDSLRLVVIGGEAVSPARLADWRRLGTDRIRLLNTYGCTETTLVTHAAELHGPLAAGTTASAAGTTASAGPVPIGRALPHVREHVTPDGELLIGGPALATGYHGLPAATADRFTTLDTGDGPRRYFRTGDRVERLPDGALLHRGRLDHEVKIRGVRVDPGEVEAHLAGHPAVGAAAVVGVGTADHVTLAAYVLPLPGTDTAGLARELTRFLRDRVPGHLVPGRITVVADLAWTASGKVDRAASHRRHTTGHHPKEAIA
ncbi:AMP-binding protein [Micromonospora zhanjiangensis]|uniref:AMP-binding protein n=1 Tax=Micromonospora zhanjiangensis TaxID=1522057 RepID=A0ABV8KU45_9ACTN